MRDDPIVDEVRKVREQLARSCGFDVGKLLDEDRAFLRTWKGRMATGPFHPEWHAPRAVVAEAKVAYGRKDAAR